MAVLRIDSIRMKKDWMSFFKSILHVSGDSERLGETLEIAEFELKASKATQKLVLKDENQVFENPTLGVGKWDEVNHLDWDKVLANDDYYADEIRSRYSLAK